MNNKNGVILFSISVFCCLFWISAQLINVYALKAVGMVYELLSLPVLLTGGILLLLSLITWIKEKCNRSSIYLKIISLYLLTILVIVLIHYL
jgi:hypothetical protein